MARHPSNIENEEEGNCQVLHIKCAYGEHFSITYRIENS